MHIIEQEILNTLKTIGRNTVLINTLLIHPIKHTHKQSAAALQCLHFCMEAHWSL